MLDQVEIAPKKNNSSPKKFSHHLLILVSFQNCMTTFKISSRLFLDYIININDSRITLDPILYEQITQGDKIQTHTEVSL